MSVINTNVKALYTQNALKASGRDQSVAMQQLSTGKRINSAKDDAAGLAISKRMTQQIRSLDMAIKNAGDAVALIQTAEGATSSITDMLQRMRELSIQAINDTNAQDQRGYLDLEFQQLKQQIQTITNQTQWNGFAILNGTAGESVGAKPIYKASSYGSFYDKVSFNPEPLDLDPTETVTLNASDKFLKSGTFTSLVAADGSISGQFTFEDGSVKSLTSQGWFPDLVISGHQITITASSGLVSADVTSARFENSVPKDFEPGDTPFFKINRSMPSVAPMLDSDLEINGVPIPAATAASDRLSPRANAATSAIARAAAINSKTAETGVAAKVNPSIVSGISMVNGAVVTGTLNINGFITPQFSSTLNNLNETRNTVVNAINAVSAQTGVKAVNSGFDNQGIRLVAQDGRNVEVGFNSTGSDSDFGARIGLSQGLKTGTYSLESSSEGQVNLTSSGDWARAGIRTGNYSDNISVLTTRPRPWVSDPTKIEVLGGGDLVINGTPIRGADPLDDVLSSTVSATSSRAGSAIALAAAINASSLETGVTAVARPAGTSASATPTTTTSDPAYLYLNGAAVSINLTANEDPGVRLNNIIAEINQQQGMHGVLADKINGDRLRLRTPDGRNLSIWTSTALSELGLSGTSATYNSNASFNFTGATTVYGHLSLKSDQPLTLSPGANGFGVNGDFRSLAFEAGTYGGEVPDDESQLTPPRTGRLSFHVGANAAQSLSIDLADFGSKGPITGEITGDVALAGSEQRVNRIDSSDNAKEMLGKLDRVLDRVNGNRAMMGAVMNRLEYVIENLSNVSLNTEASRSQIEDADYAKASTELARTQIMQQAATSVLAQANMDQQTVLKLLQ